LTSDIELKTTQNGKSVCSYTLAVNRPKVKDTTDFIVCVTWNQGAEYLSNYAHKGDKIGITGVLTSRKWQDQNGNNRISYEVVTDTVEILSNASNSTNGGQATNSTTKPQSGGFSTPAAQNGWETIVLPEDCPF
jgi:single-strand DNA-binding protein